MKRSVRGARTRRVLEGEGERRVESIDTCGPEKDCEVLRGEKKKVVRR